MTCAEPVTGTITFGNDGVKITGASITGNDDLGNSWTITSTGTTSYSQNTGYSQVGKKDLPATSITFTTTLSDETTITAMSAKFGGFSGTAGTVTLKVGDEIVGSGALNETTDVIVSATNEAAGQILTVTVTNISRGVKCYYVSYTYDDGATPKQNPNLSFGSTLEYTTTWGDAFTAPTLQHAEGFNGTVTYESSVPQVATVTETGEVTILASGQTTITASFDGTNNETWKSSSASYTLKVNKKNPEFSYGQTEYNATLGQAFTAPTLQYAEGFNETVTYTSSNSGVATISDEGAVTINAAGTTIIKASFTNNNNKYWTTGSAQYTLTVVEPFTPGDYLWVNTNLADLTNDDVFVIVGTTSSGSYALSNNNGASNPPAAVSVKISGNYLNSNITDNLKWTKSGTSPLIFYPNGNDSEWLYCTNANNGVRVGTNANKEFTMDNSGYLKHTATSRYLGVYEDNPDWRCYTSSSSTNIAGQTFAFYKRVEYATITLADACTDGTNYYGTYSNSSAFVVPEDLTVSEIGVNTNGKLNVQNYAAGAIVPANTGVMLSSATDGDHIIVLSNETGTSVLGTNNRLRPSGNGGISAAAMATAAPSCKYYRLTMHNGTDLGFYWGAPEGASFDLAANKAYLAIQQPSPTQGFIGINPGEESGIEAVFTTNDDSNVYDLQGRRVAQPQKGLYIVNGKKVIIK